MEFHVAMMHENVWFDRLKYEEEVDNYQRILAGNVASTMTASTATSPDSGSTLVNQIAQARANIKQSFKDAPVAASTSASSEGLKSLEKENKELAKLVADLTKKLAALEVRVNKVESTQKSAPAPSPAAKAPEPAKPAAPPAQKDDSDDDMFGSDDDDDDDDEETPAEKAKREKMEKMKADAAKPKKVVIAKSEVTLDVKPWDDETCMEELERLVRTIAMEGLVWGSSKLEPVGYGIFKLRIRCVVVDDLVSTDDIEDQIIGFGDHVQSMDIFAFNKI